MTTSAVPGDHHTTTALSAERWTEIRSLDLLALMDDTSAPIVSRALADLIAEVERLRAALAEEERASAERGRYLAEVDAALIAAGQDEAGGYIAYPRRVQQLAGEARFWHFEYREAMDNYKDEAAALRDARAELATARAAIEAAIDVINAGPQMVNDHVQQHWSVVARRAAEALRSPAGQ